jgi:hypothetical protein
MNAAEVQCRVILFIIQMQGMNEQSICPLMVAPMVDGSVTAP